MSSTLLDRLSEYCDKLIGESPALKSGQQKKKKKRNSEENYVSTFDGDTPRSLEHGQKKFKRTVKESFERTDKKNNNRVNQNISGLSDGESDEKTENSIVKELNYSSGESRSQNSSNLFTDDGFKIVSNIPKDDSDVSDAFEEDIDEDDWESPLKKGSNPLKLPSCGVKTTDDGFKIISEIPADDSDVSDAFTDEEDDYDDTGKDLLMKRKQISSGKGLSKPILKMIDDFGLDGDILKRKDLPLEAVEVTKNSASEHVFAVRKSKKKKKNSKGSNNTSTLAARLKPQVDVTVYDYAIKRGPSEKTLRGEITDEKSLSGLSKEDIEKQIKSMRFDIYKFGMSGFGKKKKKETRAALAIKLGAVPHKKTGMLYKNMLLLKKKEKEKEKRKREMNKEMGIENKKMLKKDSKAKKKQRSYSSQVGRFKDGVLTLSKKDLAKIKKAK